MVIIYKVIMMLALTTLAGNYNTRITQTDSRRSVSRNLDNWATSAYYLPILTDVLVFLSKHPSLWSR